MLIPYTVFTLTKYLLPMLASLTVVQNNPNAIVSMANTLLSNYNQQVHTPIILRVLNKVVGLPFRAVGLGFRGVGRVFNIARSQNTLPIPQDTILHIRYINEEFVYTAGPEFVNCISKVASRLLVTVIYCAVGYLIFRIVYDYIELKLMFSNKSSGDKTIPTSSYQNRR